MVTASRHTPSFSVKVDGRALPPPVLAAMREIVVDQSVEMADAFTIILANEGGKLPDDKIFQPGKKVEIELGYREHGGKLTKVIEGEIVAIKAVFPRRGGATVRVQGYTKYHRLMRGRQIRQFSNLTYAQIAQRIAAEVGLQAACDPTSPNHECVFQHNQTNLELLLEMADRVGYEVFAGDGTLFFRKPTPSGAVIRSLKRGESLMSFNARVQAALVPNGVSVRDWDAAKKESFVGVATDRDVPPGMGGTDSALKVAATLGKATKTVRASAVDGREAEAHAKAILTKAALGFVRADADVTGAPDLRPGFVVDIDGVGPIFSGQYYIIHVAHSFAKAGFHTRIGLRRSAIQKGPTPLKVPPPTGPFDWDQWLKDLLKRLRDLEKPKLKNLHWGLRPPPGGFKPKIMNLHWGLRPSPESMKPRLRSLRWALRPAGGGGEGPGPKPDLGNLGLSHAG